MTVIIINPILCDFSISKHQNLHNLLQEMICTKHLQLPSNAISIENFHQQSFLFFKAPMEADTYKLKLPKVVLKLSWVHKG